MDFKKCLYNPDDIDFWLKADALEELGGEKQMRWVIAVYDPKSPLVKKYPDLKDRRLHGSEYAGYEPDGSETEAIMGYLKLVNSRVWAAISAIETAMWEQMEFLIKPVMTVGAGEDKDKLAAVNMKKVTAESVMTLNEMLETLSEKFNPDDVNKTGEEKAARKRVSAESISKKIQASKYK
ncbi:hypothetical protein [Niabella terrae]